MQGADSQSESLFGMVKLEDFAPAQQPLRPIRAWVDDALAATHAPAANRALLEHVTVPFLRR